ncbi:MAG: hypothetical protein ACR2GY_03680 [Phycisphaerales bacterium]
MMANMTFLGGWVPFFDPLNFFLEWGFLLALPLAVCVSMVYKAMRVNDVRVYWRQVAVMTVQFLLGLIALWAILFFVVEWVVRW